MRTNGAVISADGWGNLMWIFMRIFIESIGDEGLNYWIEIYWNSSNIRCIKWNINIYVLDINKSEKGIETTVVGENNLDERDAHKALGYLKLKMRSDGNS